MIQKKEIDGFRCHISIRDTGAPYIYWPMQLHGDDDVEKMLSMVDDMADKRAYNLVAFEANDWNGDFSPWEAPPAFGAERFAGNGKKTLQWLEERCIPMAEGHIPGNTEAVRCIAGYSLAGLFSLWGSYETGLFSGAASCSGSLWFPGWPEYLRSHHENGFASHQKGFIYLSLGTKEEKTKNQAMASVGDATRETARLLGKGKAVGKSILEWNPGGHFTEPGRRTARGIAWLLSNAG